MARKMETKSVAFVSNTSFSLYNFRLGLMRKIKELGYRVIAIAPSDDYSSYLKREFAFYPVKNLDRRGTNPFKDFILFLEYLKIYSETRPDVVINFTIKPNIYSSIACSIFKIHSISVITGLGYVYTKGGLLKKIVELLYRFSLKRNKFVVVLNIDDLEILRNLVATQKLVLIGGEGINMDLFKKEFCGEIESLEESRKNIFLFIGRFLRDKGVYELIQAGQKLYQERKDFEIWLLGSVDSGNPSSLKEEEIRDIGKLQFVKILPFTKDVRPFICQADCVILPSYREGIPRSLLEAMAMEKPIITTDSPGCREVCRNGVNGYLVKPMDSESLKKAMERFINLSFSEREKMGKEGRKFALENFDEKLYIDKFSKLIVRCLDIDKK